MVKKWGDCEVNDSTALTDGYAVRSAYKSHLFAAMNIEDDLQQRWWKLEEQLMQHFGKKPDLDAVLYLIGLQEMQFFEEKITKETKQDLMHVAVCTILSPSGYYQLQGRDPEGWPHFTQTKALPELHLKAQEDFLKDHVLLYFGNQDMELRQNQEDNSHED